MKRNVGLTYGEFEFPAEQGFTGSRGVRSVKGYQRGGAVKKMAGGFMGPEREITVDDVTISTPRAKGGRVGKKRGGYMHGGMHGKLKRAGAKLGFSYGGRVKKYGASGDTSGEFKMKKGKQKTMDHGVQPARRGKNARNQAEAEAGGTGRLKPGLSHGGCVGKAIRKISNKGMPANVKARGGLAAHVAKARGGSVKK